MFLLGAKTLNFTPCTICFFNSKHVSLFRSSLIRFMSSPNPCVILRVSTTIQTATLGDHLALH